MAHRDGLDKWQIKLLHLKNSLSTSEALPRKRLTETRSSKIGLFMRWLSALAGYHLRAAKMQEQTMEIQCYDITNDKIVWIKMPANEMKQRFLVETGIQVTVSVRESRDGDRIKTETS